MRKFAIVASVTLLMFSTANAGSTTGLNAKSLSQAIHHQETTASDKGDLEIVYGGQDISRSGMGLVNPVLVG